MTKDEAINLVRKHLDQHQPKDYRLHVFEEATRFEDDWWIVAVGPDRTDIRRYDYYDILAQVEREIEDEEEANISLMPPPSGVVGTGH